MSTLNIEKNPFDSDEDIPQGKSSLDSNSNNEKKIHPEPEQQGMVVKPHCDCSTCDYWVNSADWCPPDQQKFASCGQKVFKERKKQPLLKSEKHPQKNRKILWYNPNQLTKVERQSISKTLVHGEVIAEPISMVNETYFNKEVQLSLERLNYKYSLPIQSFAWPAIFRKMNILMVGGRKSGKTLAYLPAICTFCTPEESKCQELSKYKGPLVAIVCSNSKQCEEILDLINKIYEKIQGRPKVSILTYPISHIPPTDILITIPEALLYCLKKKTYDFNFKRLCHLVLEDTSSLLATHEKSIYKILEVVDEMLEHRFHTAKVQLIVTSQKWTSSLNKLIQSVHIPPLVCIGNSLEAAFYGNIHFDVKFVKADNKIEILTGALRNEYRLYKTIVICNQSEIVKVNEWLVQNGIQTIALSEDITKEEIEQYEIEWKFMQGGHNKVLLCTDFVFDSLLYINDAMWLIHYSFPATWTGFMRRFSALLAHFKSPLESKEDEVQAKSLIMIDEKCEKETPKILKMLNRLTKNLPAAYQKYAEESKQKSECDKINANVALCNTLKLFGKCLKAFCEERHLVNEMDVLDDLPKSGKIVFKILNLKDVTQCTVQLFEHLDLQGCVDKFSDDNLKKPLVYAEGEVKKRAMEVTVGKFYAHCDYTQNGEVYTLCHVLMVDNQSVEVKLIDGLVMLTLKTKLFEVPQHLKIVDVYFCNLVPPFKDESFSGRSFYVTRTSLENVNYKNMFLTGTIFLQLDNTLWLDNVVQMFNVEGVDVIKFNLTKHLISQGVVEICKSQISSLHKLCTKCKVSLPKYVKMTAKKTIRSKDIEPQTAFLNENTMEVILSAAVNPEEFYVRLTKFQPLLESLEKDIQTAVRTEILDKNINIEIGKYYLALDPNGLLYSRVKILNAEGNKALCFYVDYGDEALIDLSQLKILPTKFLTRLPFQAIQCRLYGLAPAFGEWDDQAVDVLYNYMFEPESDIFRSLFVEARGEDDGDLLRAKKKYSVLLKDGYGERNVLINQLLLDCGFATTIFSKLDDFEIPLPPVVESDSDESLEREYEEVKEDVDEFLEDDFDLEVNDVEEFTKALGMNMDFFQPPQPPLLSIEEQKTPANTVALTQPCETPSGENPSHLTPDLYWSQTDKTVKLKIKLIGVEKYKTNLLQNRIFSFSTNINGRNYALKFMLNKRVTMGKHAAYGQEVRVILNKIESLEWLQLTTMVKRLRNVHYEMSDSQLEEPKGKKILQLDITDDESDEDDSRGPMIHDISDIDSEFDQEFPSSSDEA